MDPLPMVRSANAKPSPYACRRRLPQSAASRSEARVLAGPDAHFDRNRLLAGDLEEAVRGHRQKHELDAGTARATEEARRSNAKAMFDMQKKGVDTNDVACTPFPFYEFGVEMYGTADPTKHCKRTIDNSGPARHLHLSSSPDHA
jgi:hypothetical protein